MSKYRIKFTKTDKMRFIGHLDLLTYFQRAVKRAGVPIAYSQGFNPHQLMSFAIPLPLGMASVSEFIDIQLSEPMDCEQLKAVLNKNMSSGIEIKAVRTLEQGEDGCAALIAAADYTIVLDREIESFDEKYAKLCETESWLIEKVGKRKRVKEVDIRPDIFSLAATVENGRTVLKARIATGSQKNLKVDLLLRYIYEQLGIEFNYFKMTVTRTAMYQQAENGEFLPL